MLDALRGIALGDLIEALWNSAAPKGANGAPPQDSRLLKAGAEYDKDGKLEYLWYYVQVRDNGAVRYEYRVVDIRLLKKIPREFRENNLVLPTMRKVLKGLYNAGIQMVVMFAGIFEPNLGIAQFYGVRARGDNLWEAVTKAKRDMEAFLGAMANFEQIDFEKVDLELVEWLRKALGMPYVSVAVGHPDPRDEGSRTLSPEENQSGRLTLQQNEMVMRAFADQKEEFLFMVMPMPVDPRDVYRLQESVAQRASIWASKVHFTRTVSAGVGFTALFSGGMANNVGKTYGTQHAHGVADTVGHTEQWGTSHAESMGKNWSHAISKGTMWSQSLGRTHSVSNGVAVGHSVVNTAGTSHVVSVQHGVADTKSWAHTTNQGWFNAHTSGTTNTVSGGTAHESGYNIGGRVGGKIGTPIGGVNASIAGGYNWGTTHSSGWSTATIQSDTSGHSWGYSDMVGGAHTVSTSRGVADGISHSKSIGSSVAHMHSEADAVSRVLTRGGSESVTDSVGGSRGITDARSHQVGTSKAHSVSNTDGVSLGRTVGMTRALAGLYGISPSLSFGKTYMGEDHAAQMVANALADQERILDTIAKEGGMTTFVYVLTRTAEGKQIADTVLPQAFHGNQEIATPFRTRTLTPRDAMYIRSRAATFAPSRRPETSNWAIEPYKDATLMTLLQVSALVSPGLYEHGLASTVTRRMPPFAFRRVPFKDGHVILGHQYTHETGKLTYAPLVMRRGEMANFLFEADTRYGKSVAAMRMILETTMQWKFRSVVLDFGMGWRRLLRIVPRDHSDFWGLYPGSPRPIRWNFLQVPENITPEQVMGFVPELIANAGQMGPKQVGFIKRALRTLWAIHGVSTFSRAAQNPSRYLEAELVRAGVDPRDLRRILPRAIAKAAISHAEAAMLTSRFGHRRVAGESLSALTDDELQALAVYRSKEVDVEMLVDELQRIYSKIPKNEYSSKESIHSLLLRLEPFVEGRTASMYGRGEDSIDITTLARPWGLAILEGGEMDPYAKAVVLGIAGWQLYQDAVVRHRKGIGRAQRDAPLNILFEEANKVIGGIPSKGSGAKTNLSDNKIYSDMFRDAGKYNMYLHAIAQSPSQLPEGVTSNCNNIVAGQLKAAEDQRQLLSALGKVPTGYHDYQYLDYIATMPPAQMIIKLGLNPEMDRDMIIASVYRPLEVLASDPTDEEIREMFGR